MAGPLDGVRAKLLRADEHLVELRVRVADFLSGNPHKVITSLNPQTGYQSLVLSVQASPPLAWSVLIGEIAHNWRSGLDHMAWQLALRTGTPYDKTDFPIFKKSGAYENAFVGTRGSAQSLTTFRAILDPLQPHTRGDAYAAHPLWRLYDLADIDKHQTLHLVGAAFVRSALGIREIHGFDIHDMSVFTPPAAVEGAVLATFRLVQTDTNAILHMNPDVAFDIQFGDGSGAAAGQLLLPTLIEIGDFISREVLPPVAAVFA